VIYLDASAVLARLLAEDRCPSDQIWREDLVSSALLEYEIAVRLNAQRDPARFANDARSLLGRVALVTLAPPVLARALEPFPLPVRTLDALHLATLEFLRSQARSVELLTYDKRMLASAEAIGLAIHPES
jgi:predicted nucleic acid-binding protein